MIQLEIVLALFTRGMFIGLGIAVAVKSFRVWRRNRSSQFTTPQ